MNISESDKRTCNQLHLKILSTQCGHILKCGYCGIFLKKTHLACSQLHKIHKNTLTTNIKVSKKKKKIFLSRKIGYFTLFFSLLKHFHVSKIHLLMQTALIWCISIGRKNIVINQSIMKNTIVTPQRGDLSLKSGKAKGKGNKSQY